MKQVALITEEQAKQLMKQEYTKGSLFNPMQDADGNWFISVEELRDVTDSKHSFVKNSRIVPYKPVAITLADIDKSKGDKR